MSFSSRTDQGYLSFAKGLVTEYNPLAAPEGTTFDELNMDVDTDGFVRTRRKPISSVSLEPMSGAEGAIEYSAVWEDLDKVLVVVKRDTPDTGTGNLLIDVIVYSGGITPVKELVLYFSIPVSQYVRPSATFLRQRAMLILGGAPLLLEKDTASYNVYEINILIRDFKLLDDGLGVGTRPITLSDEHKYNLYNAGWWQERALLDPNQVGDPVVNFEVKRSEYPNNADIVYLGDITDTNGDLKFKPAAFDNVNLGSTEAPRGHYVYDIRNIDRNLKLSAKNIDGTQLATLVKVLDDGNDPGTGTPPDPTTPIIPPRTECLPGEICTIEP